MEKNNPFKLQGYTTKEYFCDREKELATLHENFDNDRNTVLFSWRRLGKTSLIRYFLKELERSKKIETLYIDLLATRDSQEAIRAIATSTYERFGETSKTGLTQSLQQLLGKLGVEMGFDPQTGLPSIGFSLNRSNENPEVSLTAIGEYLMTKKTKVIIAIDEFQQISHYPDSKGEAIFGSWMQNFPELRFVFSGSHRGIMTSMFTSENRPFYKSAQLMSLDTIDQSKYRSFINSHFKSGGKQIEEAALDAIFDWSWGQTYTIHLICNKLYGRYDRVSLKEFEIIIDEILGQESTFFSQLANLLSKTQWNVLTAIAREGRVKNPLSSKFLKSNNLKAASSVGTALKMLQSKEIVVRDGDAYRVHDILFMRWMQQL